MSSVKSKKRNTEPSKHQLVYRVDPTECPFREFRDNELSADLWGLGPSACRAVQLHGKAARPPADQAWEDEQTQPLPRSVRRYLHGWVRAEELAAARWGSEVVVFEENAVGGKMSIQDTQLSHAQVLMRSSFCRRVLSACFLLERAIGITVEHQWENFACSFVEGWRARYHVYSPGLKPGGGPQHRPTVSKNGCYLVRLYYLGAWRCVWVNDQVPLDATDAPLLPFSPLQHSLPTKPGVKAQAVVAKTNVVELWPMLICKALLKLAAPDMSGDEEIDSVEDETMSEFNLLHALTGSIDITHTGLDSEELWKLISKEVPMLIWEDDDETLTSTVKSRTKKPNAKDNKDMRTRNSLTTIVIKDTKDQPPYLLPGISPGHEMTLLVNMARDLPLKKPLPEPEVALWKYHRWVDWARGHGLYEAYECPRTRFLKVTGLLKLSYAPHLLDVMSTESITYAFREQQEKTVPPSKKTKPELDSKMLKKGTTASANQSLYFKEELKEWMVYNTIFDLFIRLNVIYFPSMFNYTTSSSSLPIRTIKAQPSKTLDIPVPKCSPLYLQIDCPEEITLRLALSTMHPRVIANAGVPVEDFFEPAHLVLENFEWFVNCKVANPKAFVQTRGYDSVEVNFTPGRHVCRLWVHSRLSWHVMLLSQATVLLGSRDVIQAAAVIECPWASKFLNNLSNSFAAWIKINRSNLHIVTTDREFYKSYQPDLTWDPSIVGYDKHFLHWMFRQALQSHLRKRLPTCDFIATSKILRHLFWDPDFGLPLKPLSSLCLRDIASTDPCDCVIPEVEETKHEEVYSEKVTDAEEQSIIDSDIMAKLLSQPTFPNFSQICDHAKHEAATKVQAYWRGYWARKCLRNKGTFSAEILKQVVDHAFGNLEATSGLMNEFFSMFPGAKTAYSVASALRGTNGLQRLQGTVMATSKCKWIPYFQGIFFCHSPVKVHFTLQSSLQYSTLMVYDNDTNLPLPSVFNAHLTFDMNPNNHGYTVMGHGTMLDAKGHNFDSNWQLTILSSREGAFHICDNQREGCKELPLPSTQKLRVEDVFIPNRRNILGGILISVAKDEAVSFHATASSPELDILATLSSISITGETEELASCSGKGEIYWPFIRLQPHPFDLTSMESKKSLKQEVNNLPSSARSVPKSATPKRNVASARIKSMTKMQPVELKQFLIQVTAPLGWPLTIDQWKRVEELRNQIWDKRVDNPQLAKKSLKIAIRGGKDLTAQSKESFIVSPLPGDAFVELECALSVNGGTAGKRDDRRYEEFATVRKEWEINEPGRNSKGAEIRNEFRNEYLVPPKAFESLPASAEETLENIEGEEFENEHQDAQQRPTPATESGVLEMSVELEEQSKYLDMPQQLHEKFIPLDFVPFCMKDQAENTVVLSMDMIEAAMEERRLFVEEAKERTKALQEYNEQHILIRQKRRCKLLEQFSVDASWCPQLIDIFKERDDTIARETLARQVSANRKKQEKDQSKLNDQTRQSQKKKK